MSGKKSLIEAYMKNLDKKVTAKKAGQNRIGEAAAIQGGKASLADIPVYRPTITVQVQERVSDGKPLVLPKVEKKNAATVRTDGPSDTAAADIIANAFAEQEKYAATLKPLTKNEQRQADRRTASREKAEKADLRSARKDAIAEAKAERNAARAAAGEAYATAADPAAALPAYKAALSAANADFEAAKKAAWEPENKAVAPERYDPYVQYAGLVEAELYDPTVVQKGEKAKANPLTDFAEYAKQVARSTGQTPAQVFGVAWGKDGIRLAGEEFAQRLTDSEKAYVNYLYGTYDTGLATDLTMAFLQNKENQRILASESGNVGNALSAVGGNVLASPTYALEMLGQAGENLVNGTNLAVPEYSYGSRMMGEQAARTQALLDGTETPVGEFLAQTGIGVGQNVVNTLLFGKLAPAMMALQAAGSSGYEAAQNGATGWQQLGKGVQSAATEFITEKVSWGKLDDILKNPGEKTVKSIVAQIGAQMATEAGEETVGEAVGMIYDWMAMGDKGDLAQVMKAYREEHGDDGAAAELALQILQRLGVAAASGALSGLALGGGATAVNAAMSNATIPTKTPVEAVQSQEVSDVGEDAKALNPPRPVEDFAVSVAQIAQQHEQTPSTKKERLEPQQIAATSEKMDTAIRDLTGEDGTGVNIVLTQNAAERMLDKGLTAAEIADAMSVLEDFDEAYLSTETSAKFRDKNGGSAKQISFVKNVGDGAVVVDVALDTRNGQYAVADVALDDTGLSAVKAWDGNIDMQPYSAETAQSAVPPSAENAQAIAGQSAEAAQPGYAAANADAQSIGAKKAAFKYKEADSKQKSTESVVDTLSDMELAELDTAFPAQETTHQKVSVKQNEELARQRIEADFEGEKSDLTKKESWNAEDIATAQAVLMKLREDWRNEKEASKRTAAREAFNNWYDVVAEHKSVVAQAMRQMQEYVAKMAADDPKTALEVIQHELDKVNAKGESEFGDKWRDIKLTDEEKYRIDSLAPGDTKTYLEIVDDIGKRIQEEYPAKLREKIRELSRINMLLNVRTLFKNPLANLFLQGVSRTSAKVSALAQNAIHAFDKDYEPTQAFVISKESKDLAKAVWDEIGETVVEKGQKYDPNANPKEDGLLLKRVPKKEVFKKTVIDRKLPFLGKAAEGTAGFLNKLSRRMTGAELFVEMTDEKSMLENTRQLTYGLLELGDRGFMRSSFIYRLASYCEAMGIDSVEDIPEDAYRLAIESSFMDTFKDDNWATELAQGLKKALDKAAGAGEILMPFTKTPANVTKRSIEYSPAGFVSSTVKAIAKGRTAAKSGDINNGRELSRAVDMMAKGLTGSALMAAGIIMYNAGRITGGYPEDKDEAAFLEQAGWKPFSFVTKGGKYISFDWAQPAAMTLILGASAADNWGRGGGKGLLEHGKDFAVVFFDTIFEQSTLQELEKLFGGYGRTGENVIDVVLNYPTRFISSGLYAAAKVADPVKRETYEKNSGVATLLNKMQYKIPGLSKKLPAKYDIWGNVVKRDETYGEAFINAYFNPGTVTQYKETPANDEILRLYEATLDRSVFPMATDRGVEMDVDGKRIEVQCDNEQFSDLCKNTGKARTALMNAALDSAWYKGLTNDEKVKFLYEMWSLAKVAGKVKTFPDGEIPGAQNNKVYDVYARDGAAGVLRYYQIKDEADTDGNTDLSQKETLLYLKGQNWDSAEKGKWLGTLVTAKGSDTQKVKEKYGDSAMGSWYDYYSVLYADAERHRAENGLKTVNVGSTDQINMAKDILANLEASKEQKAYYWEITGDSKTWKEENPYK